MAPEMESSSSSSSSSPPLPGGTAAAPLPTITPRFLGHYFNRFGGDWHAEIHAVVMAALMYRFREGRRLRLLYVFSEESVMRQGEKFLSTVPWIDNSVLGPKDYLSAEGQVMSPSGMMRSKERTGPSMPIAPAITPDIVPSSTAPEPKKPPLPPGHPIPAFPHAVNIVMTTANTLARHYTRLQQLKEDHHKTVHAVVASDTAGVASPETKVARDKGIVYGMESWVGEDTCCLCHPVQHNPMFDVAVLYTPDVLSTSSNRGATIRIDACLQLINTVRMATMVHDTPLSMLDLEILYNCVALQGDASILDLGTKRKFTTQGHAVVYPDWAYAELRSRMRTYEAHGLLRPYIEQLYSSIGVGAESDRKSVV